MGAPSPSLSLLSTTCRLHHAVVRQVNYIVTKKYAIGVNNYIALVVVLFIDAAQC